MVTQRKTTNSSTRSTRVIIDRTRRTRTATESSLVSAYVAEVPLKPAKVKDLLKIASMRTLTRIPMVSIDCVVVA